MARHTFFTVEKLGPKQSLTPEGFLLCEEVPLARTGMMIYGPDETPIEAGPDGIVKIFREPEDVFTPETIASAQGKSVTNDHPNDDVTPTNWKDLSCGIMMNVRRGIDNQDDLLFGDLLITTIEGIGAVRQGGKVEVSLGYDADYEQTGEGMGKQKNILINHIALVDNGRCGPRCAIGDSKTKLEDIFMAATNGKKTNDKKTRFVDMLTRAFKAKDAAEVEELAKQLDEEFGPEEGGDVHVHVHNSSPAPAAAVEDEEDPELTNDDDYQAKNDADHAEFRARIEALEAKLSGGTSDEDLDPAATGDAEAEEEEKKEMMDEVPEELKEEASKAKDSAYLVDSFQDTVALAEILVPGIRIPTFDKATKPGDTFKAICSFRRTVLDAAYALPVTRPLIDQLLAGKKYDSTKMTRDAARSLFRSAAALKRTLNNTGALQTAPVQDQNRKVGVTSIADLNRLNRERFGG